MCQHGNHELINVKIQAELSCTGKEKWKKMKIDSCIAPIVESLQKSGIDMRGCCCGHNNGEGDIHLQDGRTLIILSKEQSDIYYSKKSVTKTFVEYLKEI